MDFLDNVKAALFVMAVVFVLLGAIYGLIKLSSTVIMRFTREDAKR